TQVGRQDVSLRLGHRVAAYRRSTPRVLRRPGAVMLAEVLARENLERLLFELRSFLRRRYPDDRPINCKVSMHRDITKRYDIRPLNVRMTFSKLRRQASCCLADNCQLVQYRAAQKVVLHEGFARA